MLPLYILVPLNILLIVIYFFARLRDNKPLVRVIQPAAVITSWVLAAIRLLFEGADLPLTLFVLAGMGIAIVGDFLNIDMSDMKVVLRGLVIAVIAYLTYAVGLTILNGFHLQDLYVGAALLLVYAFTMRTIMPGVDQGMRLPVLIYGLVLPFTFSRALSTFFSGLFSSGTSIFLSLGTFSLFIGDIEFAIDSFKKKLPFMLGPFLYAGGQLLIALSVWF